MIRIGSAEQSNFRFFNSERLPSIATIGKVAFFAFMAGIFPAVRGEVLPEELSIMDIDLGVLRRLELSEQQISGLSSLKPLSLSGIKTSSCSSQPEGDLYHLLVNYPMGQIKDRLLEEIYDYPVEEQKKLVKSFLVKGELLSLFPNLLTRASLLPAEEQKALQILYRKVVEKRKKQKQLRNEILEWANNSFQSKRMEPAELRAYAEKNWSEISRVIRSAYSQMGKERGQIEDVIQHSGRNGIFESLHLPKIIIKLHASGQMARWRFERNQKAQEVVRENNLSFLRVPHMVSIPIGKGSEVIIEEKLAIIGDHEAEYDERLWFLLDDPQLARMVKDAFVQLRTFVQIFGLKDASPLNTPFLANDFGFALIDTDQFTEMVPIGHHPSFFEKVGEVFARVFHFEREKKPTIALCALRPSYCGSGARRLKKAIRKFWIERGIQDLRDPFEFDQAVFTRMDPKEQDLALRIQTIANFTLSVNKGYLSCCFPLGADRRVTIDLENLNKLDRAVPKKEAYQITRSALLALVKKLRKEGQIFHFQQMKKGRIGLYL